MQISRQRIATLRQREDKRFMAERPHSMQLLRRSRRHMPAGVPMSWMTILYTHTPFFIRRGYGAHITDIDGNSYLDMNLADTSMACGYGPQAVAEAVYAQFRRGSQFLLPTEETVEVAEMLAERFGMPHWQFTLSASSANADAIRIARAFTGRDRILLFDGKYHGMLDETFQAPADNGVQPEAPGLARDSGRTTDIVPYNDLAAARVILERGQTACVLVEPGATNTGGVLMPQPGFLGGLRALTKDAGTVLIVDEAHTHVCAYGGLKREWSIACDILVLGKAIAGGIPAGIYGLSDELSAFVEDALMAAKQHHLPGLAVGGTLFGNALQVAAIRATLLHVLTKEAQIKAAKLGAELADGIEAGARRRGLRWSAHRLYCRSGYHFAENLPLNNSEAEAARDTELRDLMRVYMANRGVWEAIHSASPAVSLAAERADIDLYLSVYESCLDDLVAG